MLPKIGKEITKVWKTPVSSLRGVASSKGATPAKVNPRVAPGHELRGRASSARTAVTKHK